MIDTTAVLKFLARSTPGIIEELPECGVSTYPRLFALSFWLQIAALAGNPDMANDIEEMAVALQAAYDAAMVAFKNANPGVLEAVRDAGSMLVLVPPVAPDQSESVN